MPASAAHCLERFAYPGLRNLSKEVGKQIIHGFALAALPAMAAAGMDVDKALKETGLVMRTYPAGAVGYSRLNGVWMCEGVMLISGNGRNGYAKYVLPVTWYVDNVHVEVNSPNNELILISRSQAENLTVQKLP